MRYVLGPPWSLGSRKYLGSFPCWGRFRCSNCFAKWIFWKEMKFLVTMMLLIFFAQTQFKLLAAERAPSWSPQRLPCLGPTRRRHPPPHPLYDSPYAVLCQAPHAFTLQVRQREEIIAVSRVKACMAADATSGNPQRCSRLLGPRAAAMPAAAHPGDPAATKWVSFSDLLVSPPSKQEQLRIRPGTVFLLPLGRFCTTLGRQLLHSLHRHGIFHRQRKSLMRINLWYCPLLSQGQRLGNSSVEAPMPLVPSQFQHGNSTLYSSTAVHCVQSLYINRYVCSNKPLLS